MAEKVAEIPPNYADLGKAAKDLFSKGFNHGIYKLELKTKTDSGVEFTTGGSSNHDSGKVHGTLETKYKWKDYGLTFLEKWNTDNTLGTEITIEDELAKGLKLSFDTTFAPQTGKKSGKIKTGYKQDYVNFNADVDFDFAGPTLHAAGVLGYSGWLAGAQVSFDTSKSTLTRNSFAVGFQKEDFQFNTQVNDGTEFVGSIYQRIRRDLETGVQLSWTSGNNASKFGVAAKYIADRNTTFRAKVNNASQVGLSYQQKVREGVTLTLSTLIEGKAFNQGGHKFGVGLDLEA